MLATDNRTYIEDIHFETAEELLKSISYGGDLYKILDENFIFRGHSSDKYRLLPTALRCRTREIVYPNTFDPDDKLKDSEYGQIDAEARLLFSFYQQCDKTHLYVPNEKRLQNPISKILSFDYSILLEPEYWIADEYQELAGLAQHHGVPTRLLDWTSDINVALYFASSSTIKKAATPKKMTREEWSKDKKLIEERIYNYFTTHKLEAEADDNMELWALDTTILSVVNKFSMPLKITKPCYHNNANLAAQKGLFTYWQIKKPLKLQNEKTIADINKGVCDSPLDLQITEFLEQHQVSAEKYIYLITIPHSEAIKLYEYAKRNHCDASFLFPGYGGVARCLEEDGYLKKIKSELKKE